MTAQSITVRMYNVGFGDCFLLRLPTDGGPRRMLVDCGYHSSGKGKFSDRELVEQVKQDLAGEPLDVVVATHRHQDHISGFGEEELWKDVAVDEVWLPFTARETATEDDPSLAAWEDLRRGVASLVKLDGKLAPAVERAMAARSQDEREALEWMLWNARANAPGIHNLLHGMRRADRRQARRRFLPERGHDVPWSFGSEALPGVTIHVLGPSTDPAHRKNRKVPAGWAVFGAALDENDLRELPRPFGPEWEVEDSSGRKPFSEKNLAAIRVFNDDLLAAANAVEGFLNGESLVLVLEVGRARLLLTGDAEVAAWTKILGDPRAEELAAGATFLKIGHHGSHNATPLPFVRGLAEAMTVMISTQAGSGKFRNGIPLPTLLAELGLRRANVARSDRPDDAPAGTFTAGPNDRWVDCSLPC